MKAFVLLSGGIDSTTCMALAEQDVRRGNVHSFSIDYGQRHKKEILSAIQVAAYYEAKHTVLQYPGMPKTMLTDKDAQVPDISYDEIQGISPTYVPFRNGLMLSMLAAQAQAYARETMEDVTIYFGAHAEDAKNWAYPDCTPEFIGAMQNAIFIGSYQTVRLAAPLTYMTKKEIIRTGIANGVPYNLTWSCYKGEELHCGVCPTCRSRKRGFIDMGIVDPTQYAA